VLLVALLSCAFAQDCFLAVPFGALTAAGLATPHRLLLPCNQSNTGMSTFVQGAIIDQTAGKMFVYNPLVITDGTAPAMPTTPVNLPAKSVVALWFGTNAGTITLVDVGGSLAEALCVNGGGDGSIFGQFAYCNAVLFFSTAFTMITAKQLQVPALGIASDGQICPTTRDFVLVDMDQSDNVITSYIDIGNAGAQDTLGNRNALLAAGKVINTLKNGSDMRLLSIAMDGALGCTPWRNQDLADPLDVAGLPTFGSAEIQAAIWQLPPVALCPLSHPMTRVNNQPSLEKTNKYRAGCGQVQALKAADADSFQYCWNLYYVGPKRLAINANVFSNAVSPDTAAATNLFAFLGQRYANSFGPDGLNCASLLNQPPPIIPIKNMGGVFVGATINVPVAPVAAGAPVGLSQTNLIIIVVCSVGGGLLIIGLIIGVIIYRRRSMYS